MMRTMLEEGNMGGALLRCLIMLLAVATVVASMVVAAAAPASAAQPTFTCFNESTGTTILDVTPSSKHDFQRAGFTCVRSDRVIQP